LDSKEAKGDKMYLAGSTLVILDSDRGAIYTLSVEKKSLTTYLADSIKSAEGVVGYDDQVFYLLPNIGMYEAESETKMSKVFDADADWDSIVDISMFNNNFYLLDSGKNQLYKYVPIEDGYGAKKNYFTSDAIALKGDPSLAIDGSVFIAYNDTVLKYTGGIRDEFKPAFPEEDVRITKVISGIDSDKVYLWDKQKGTVYVLSKDGDYEQQIDSSKFKEAGDVTVYETTAYALVGEKLYAIDVR